jgi:protein TonB
MSDSHRPHRLPEARSKLPPSVLLGTAFAIVVFVLISLAQMIGNVEPPEAEIDETAMAFEPPEVEQAEEQKVPPAEEPPPELQEELPELSLDQLDIALNPGTGGSLLGDFSMVSFNTSLERDLGTQAFLDFSALDQVPRPIGVSGFNFPQRLLKKKASGKIVVLLKLNSQGEVLDAQIDSSNLPEFEAFVLNEIKRWKFTPPMQQGRPVQAQARLPIPITIN